MSLERVAVLEGAALKEGLRREARTLSRELRGWTGRHGKDDTDAHPNHTGIHTQKHLMRMLEDRNIGVEGRSASWCDRL
jgi:hypothetical protein